jgi:hypothetical protein
MPALLIFFLLICLPLRSEHIFLKDGSIISGQVVRDGADSVSIRDSDQKDQGCETFGYLAQLYTELKMGKITSRNATGRGSWPIW